MTQPVLGQKAPSAKRCIKTQLGVELEEVAECQKAPSAKRCIKTASLLESKLELLKRQKAPSAKRCIKTQAGDIVGALLQAVRKHRAPKGALRRNNTHD